VVFAANPRELLDVPYPGDYARVGAAALMALALGNVAFSVFAIAGTILNGAGQTRAAIRVAAITLTVAAVANALVIPRFDPGPELHMACAGATAGAMVLGAALAAWALRATLGASLPIATALRVALAGAAAVALGHAIATAAPLAVLGESAVVGGAF